MLLVLNLIYIYIVYYEPGILFYEYEYRNIFILYNNIIHDYKVLLQSQNK